MKHGSTSTSLPLILIFLIFSMLLNCMGIMILQFSEENISFQGLGFLESFKDLPIALASLFAVQYINRFGTLFSLKVTTAFLAVCCFLVPLLDSFWLMKMWFVFVGLAFAVGKITTFSLLRTNYSKTGLVEVMNQVEASFMFGIFAVNMGFGWLLGSRFKEYWTFGFWGIALLALLATVLLYKVPMIDTPKNLKEEKSGNLLSLLNSKTVLFLSIMFFIVFIEQCLNSWLPTFYRDHFKVSTQFALQSSAFLALFSFAGRFLTSKLIHRFSWFRYIIFCVSFLMLLLILMYVFMNYYEVHSFFLVYLIPMIGLFLSPLYPVINSKMISQYEPSKVSQLISLLVIASSLGSSFGSIYISWAFHFDLSELYPIFILCPILLLTMMIFFFRKSNLSK